MSSSFFFNEKSSYDLDKNKYIIIKENDEKNNKNNKINGADFLTVKIENIIQNNIFFNDENNDSSTKIHGIKKKKFREKHKSYNKGRQQNFIKEIEGTQKKDSLNIQGKEEEKNIDSIKEDNNSCFSSSEISTNLNIYSDKNEKNNKQYILQNKEELRADLNTDNDKKNKIIINNETNKLVFINKLINNNINNNIYINNENGKYINKNIYNNLNNNQNLYKMNIGCSNNSKFNVLKRHKKGPINSGNIRYNNYNKTYKRITTNKFNINFNQMKGMYMNSNNYFSINNINPNNSSFNGNITRNKRRKEIQKKRYKRLNNSFYMDKPLSFLANHFYILSKDQSACRYLQKLLDANPQEILKYLYNPLCTYILPLINFPFGNYLIQKIIMHLNQEQLYEILNKISKSFLEICNNIHGTRVIQTIIDNLKTPKITNYFYQLLRPHIIDLLKDLKGTFVVQKFLKLHKDYSNKINDIIVDGSHILSTQRHGSCVIQKYLGLEEPYYVPKLIDKLLDNSLTLIVDQFGNYVIQNILKKNNKNYGNKLAEKIVENVVYFAKHKYASNVVKKCFDCCDGIYLANLIDNIQKQENLIELILDEYGNYVVQKVLTLSSNAMKRQIIKLITININELKACNHGERLINRLLINYPNIIDKNFMNEIKK